MPPASGTSPTEVMVGVPEDKKDSELRMTAGVTPARPPRPDRSASAFQSLAAGVLIGDKYRLQRCLGEGGMATVWVARNEALDIDVAIKFIRTDLTTPNLSERLLYEARAAAKLGHPAIVRVFDFGTTPRHDPYIVMELLDGEDLASVYATSGRMSPVAALRTLLPIAHALAVAHDKGIVHRDFKPENVFLVRAEDGQVQPKLLDFGVAKLDKQGYERLTQADTTLGSPAYMSPEQARGEEVDGRTDLWSFCVVLYEALSGTLPFHHENYNALMRMIIEQEPTPLTDMAAGDSELWRIIKKGLTKDPNERWSSMRNIGAALARWLIERDISADIVGASLAATWLQERQSWVDSDGVFERVVADSGLHLIAADSGLREAHLREAETLPPPAETRSAGTPVSVTPPVDLAVDRRALVPSPRAMNLVRTVAVALVGAGVALALGSLFVPRGSDSVTETSPPPPAVAPATEPGPGISPEPARPAIAPTVAEEVTSPAASADSSAAPQAATKNKLHKPATASTAATAQSATPPTPDALATKPQPKPGGLEIKTRF